MDHIMEGRYAGFLVVLTLMVAACGTGSEAPSEVASLEDSGDQEASVLGRIVDQELELYEFSVCMRDEGIDVGDPTIDADGNVSLGTPLDMISDHAALMQAYEACGEPIGGRAMGHGGEDRTAVHDRLVEFARCVRDNGYYSLPDPDFTGGDMFPGLDMDDPDYRAAEEVCRDLLVDDGS